MTPIAGKSNIVVVRRMDMTISDFATKVKISEKTVIKWINNGYIPGASVENNYVPDSARKPYTKARAKKQRHCLLQYSKGVYEFLLCSPSLV